MCYVYLRPHYQFVFLVNLVALPYKSPLFSLENILTLNTEKSKAPVLWGLCFLLFRDLFLGCELSDSTELGISPNAPEQIRAIPLEGQFYFGRGDLD